MENDITKTLLINKPINGLSNVFPRRSFGSSNSTRPISSPVSTARTSKTIAKTEQNNGTRTAKLDLDKLAKAVARHETASCTKGSAKVNNCFGIMAWSNGKRYFKRYPTKEASYADFKRIWSSHYRQFPTLALAKKYSGNDRAHIWLRNVTQFYYE